MFTLNDIIRPMKGREQFIKRPCVYCGHDFRPTTQKQIFCSDECAGDHHDRERRKSYRKEVQAKRN